MGEGLVPPERGAGLMLLAMLLAVTELVVDERAIIDMGLVIAGLPSCRGGSYSVCVCVCDVHACMQFVAWQPKL